MRKQWLLAVLLVLTAGVGDAGPMIIDFDSLNDGDVVTTQYSGVVFANTRVLTAGISLNEFEFPPFSDTNAASDDGGPISISFLTPAQSFAGYFTYFVPITVRAFDATDNEVALASSVFLNNLALSGDPGSSPNELIAVAFAGGIWRITIAGNIAGGSFTIDNATINSVPEPAAGSLVLIGATSLALLLRSGRRSPAA